MCTQRCTLRPFESAGRRPQRKSPGAWPRGFIRYDAFFFEISVARDDRRVELVARAHDRPLDVARLGVERVAAGGATELIALVLEGGVIVLEADDPVAGDAEFPAGADGPAAGPVGLTARAGDRIHNRVGDRQTIVHAGVAALDVVQVVLIGEARATDDRRQHVRAPGEHVVTAAQCGIQGRAVVVEAGDRAFEAEHVVAGLPVVADLRAAHDARAALTEAVPRHEVAEQRGIRSVDPTLIGPGAADMAADIEARPVEQRLDIGRSLRVGPRGEIGSGSSTGRDERSGAGEGDYQLGTHGTPRVFDGRTLTDSSYSNLNQES